MTPFPRANPLLMTAYRVFRNIAIPPARACLLLKDCHLHVIELSILAQTPLVAIRGCLVLPLCRAPALMDHSHANSLGLYNAVDVLSRPRFPGWCTSSLDLCGTWVFDAGSRLLLSTWWRSQAADHIYSLTIIFTFLVLVAATQGKFTEGLFLYYKLTLSWLLDIAVDGELLV